MPKVSIVIASFNHERYVAECIQSALDQTYQDFEIVITDDASSDQSVKIIKEFNDPRIRFDAHAENMGGCATLNSCIKKASGKYISVLNSDDVWAPTKLQKQVAYLEAHPETGAVFTRVVFIDELSNPIGPENYRYYYIFDKENRSRHAWLNYFFYNGNVLCHPSILIRKTCYDEVGLYDERMSGLPDLDMWVRLCLKYDIRILDEKLVRLRIRDNGANASGDLLPNHIKGYFEYMQIMNHYLTITDEQFFLNIFPEASKYGEVEGQYIPYFLSMLALHTDHNNTHLWGLKVLSNFIGEDAIAKGLEKKYGFRYKDFHNLTAKYDVFNIASLVTAPPSSQQTNLFIKTGSQSKLLKIAIRLHWFLANIVLKFISRSCGHSSKQTEHIPYCPSPVRKNYWWKIRVKKANWCGIKIMFGTHNRLNFGKLLIEVCSVENMRLPLREIEIPLMTLVDNGWQVINFGPIKDSDNHEYVVNFNIVGSGTAPCISIYEHIPKASLFRRLLDRFTSRRRITPYGYLIFNGS